MTSALETPRRRSILVPKPLAIGIVCVALGVLIWVLSVYVHQGMDWIDYFRPAALEMLAGRSPYTVEGFVNPPWLLIPLLPIALLPEKVGGAVMFVLLLGAFGYTAYRLKAKPLAMLAIILSAPVVYSLRYAQTDGLAALGFVLPPQIGLFFVLAKPQAGLAVALFWLVEAWREGGVKRVARTFAPVTLAYLLSFAIYGIWLTRGMGSIGLDCNISFWPTSLPIGLILLVHALRHRRFHTSIIAGPFFSPYLAIHSWSTALLGLAPSTSEAVVASVATWIWFFLASGKLSLFG